MPLTIGELVGFIDLDDRGFGTGLQAAGRGLARLQSTTTTATAGIESTVERSFADISKAIGEGLDPTSAIADLDRLEAALDQSLREMEAEAGQFAAELDAAIDAAFAGLDDGAHADGQRAGQALADGLRTGVGDVDTIARQAGQDAGEALADGARSGTSGLGSVGRDAGRELADGVADGARPRGSSGLSSVAADLIGSFKGAGWLAAGAAAGALLAKGIQSAMEKEDLFAELAVKVGAFGPESERLGKIAGDLYAQGYGEGLDQVTEALAKVLQNIDGADKASDKSLGNMTKQALTVSKVMGEDVSAVTRAVSQILRTDLAPNAEEAFNVLIRGQQEGVNKSEDLLDSFNEYGTHFRDLGLSAQDALGLMSQGLKGGARDSDQVSDALKEISLRVRGLADEAVPTLKKLGLEPKEMADAFAKGGDTARDAFGKIISKLREVKDPTERYALALTLFGTKNEDMAKAVNALDLSKAKTEIDNFGGAVKEADKTLQSTASTGADQWARSWEGVLSVVGEQITKWFKDMFPSPADIEAEWNQVTSWFSGTVGPFFTDIWSSVSKTTSEIWTDMGGWLSKKGGEIVEWLKAIPTKVGEFFASGWEMVRTTTSEKWEGIKAAATEKADALMTWLKDLPTKIKNFFSDAGQWLLQAGRDLISGMITGVKEKAGELLNAARSVVDNAIKGVTNFLDSHSPSRLTRDEIGVPIVQGIAEGVLLQEPTLTRTVVATAKKAIQAAIEPLSPGKPGTKPAGERLAGGIMEGVLSQEAALVATVSKVVETAKAAAAKGAAEIAKTLTTGKTATVGRYLDDAPLPVLTSKNAYMGAGSSTPAIASDAAGSPTGWSSYGQSGVTVNMYGTTVREPTDIKAVGQEFAFQMAVSA